MAELLLNVRDLHAGYGRAEVLHGLTITARAGKVITVIGPNGAGKSTLLNALMGVLEARGTVEYDGAPIGLRSLEERVMLGMALVPETRALFATMSVEDILLLGAYRQVRLGNKDSAKSLDEVFVLFPRLKERTRQSTHAPDVHGALGPGRNQEAAIVGPSTAQWRRRRKPLRYLLAGGRVGDDDEPRLQHVVRVQQHRRHERAVRRDIQRRHGILELSGFPNHFSRRDIQRRHHFVSAGDQLLAVGREGESQRFQKEVRVGW